MFPLRDDIPSRRRPLVNIALIVGCLLAFIYQQVSAGKTGRDLTIERYGMVPARIRNPDRTVVIEEQVRRRDAWGGDTVWVRPRVLDAPRIHPLWTLLSCMFLHAGWLHFIGNMWFLWIFGDNVEDRLGHARYLLFYLGCGVAANLAHLFSSLDGPAADLPTVGASGAIAGVMGAYLVLYPHARVIAAVPIIYFLQIMVIPAPVFLGVWFFIQFLSGATAGSGGGGVAWWAHIGGFVAGLGTIGLLRARGRLNPAVRRRRLTHPHRVSVRPSGRT